MSVLAAHHDLWRDEARALSIARAMGSPLDLLRVLHDEGHPGLWHLLLWAGHALAGRPAVLPALAALVAAGAVALLLWRAPFPAHVKVLFPFGVLPLYEYAVMARNYGLAMLLLFGFAALWPSRGRRPLALGAVLALLANANVHATLLAGLLAAGWALEALVRPGAAGRRRAAAGLALGLAGLAFALLTVWPDGAILQAQPHPPPAAVARAALASLGAPGRAFPDVLALWPQVRSSYALPAPAPSRLRDALVVALALGLVARPWMAAALVLGFAASGAFGAVFIPLWLRHQGMAWCFALALYWMARADAAAADAPPRWAGVRGLHAALTWALLPALLAVQVADAWTLARQDLARPESSSAAFGALLRARPELRHAVVMGEPDYLLEALPCYAPQRLFLAREDRFATWVHFTRENRRQLTLGELLAAARRVGARERAPVLLALGVPLEALPPPATVALGYGATFSWTEDDLRQLAASTTPLADYRGAVSGEDYRVYLLPPPGGAAPLTGPLRR